MGGAHPDTEVVVGGHMGVDERLVELAWARYDEALSGTGADELRRLSLSDAAARLRAPGGSPAVRAVGALLVDPTLAERHLPTGRTSLERVAGS